jgi:hypothetical protein
MAGIKVTSALALLYASSLAKPRLNFQIFLNQCTPWQAFDELHLLLGINFLILSQVETSTLHQLCYPFQRGAKGLKDSVMICTTYGILRIRDGPDMPRNISNS